MRSHGITDFPDPIFQGGTVAFPKLDRLAEPINSPRFAQARHTCQQLIPAGLPGGGRPGG